MSGILDILQGAMAERRKLLAVLLDPDKQQGLDKSLALCDLAGVDMLLAGGSLLTHGNLESLLASIKARTDIPVVIFPGNAVQVSPLADAIFLLSLISGRNAEYLIGQHVVAAPAIVQSGIAVLPTGYMLVDGGKITTASYMSGTMPLPHDKPEVAATVATAGWLLGLQCMYLDAGSGAQWPVNAPMITAVRNAVPVPVIVGGGITSPMLAQKAWNAGADMVVCGTAIEKSPDFIMQMAEAREAMQVM